VDGNELKLKLTSKYAMQNVLLSDIIDHRTFKVNNIPVWYDGKHYLLKNILNKDKVEIQRDNIYEKERSTSRDSKDKLSVDSSLCVVKDAAQFLKIMKYNDDNELEEDKEGFIANYEGFRLV